MKKRIGLFGGTFDPIHKGHVALAEQVLAKMNLDGIWFLLTPQNPWKRDSILFSDSFRLNLVMKALERHDEMGAFDYEFRLSKPSYTFQTLRHLRADYPDMEFILLIGADNWLKFSHWVNAEEILQNHKLVVYPRKGYAVDESALPDGVTYVKTELYDFSSTQIREMLSRGEDVSALVPDGVAEMLEQNKGKDFL